MEALHESRANKGMTVLGVTRQYDKRGLLPDSRDELFKPSRSGKPYTGTTTEEYIAHLKAFHERVKMPYPIVLGTSQDMKNYDVYGLPTVFVIDQQGIVNFVAIGGARAKLLEVEVDNLLARNKPADDQGSLSPASKKALDAWKAQNDALVTAMGYVAKARAQKDAAKTPDERQAAKEAVTKAGEKASDLLQSTRKAFAEAFGKADWDEFTGDEHREMLDVGLVQVAMEAFDQDPALAMRALEFYHAHVKEGSQVAAVTGDYLPWAYAAALKPDEAYMKTEALLKGADPLTKASIQVWLGDINCMAGDYDAAREHYGKVKGLVDVNRAGERLIKYAEARSELVGKAAPDIDPQWFGAEGKKLSDLKGKVVVLDFWATWCAPCRYAMVGLDKIAGEHPDVAVVGVTGKFSNGFIPDDASQMREKFAKGEAVRDIDPNHYEDHLKLFRKHSGISYPFALAGDPELSNYHIAAWPTIVILDRQGKVRFMTVGANKDALINKMIARLK